MSASVPDNTAVRVALWRAMHVQVDGAPPVLDDTLGLQLAAPDDGWRDRPDMHPFGTRGFRASIVSRARCIEDLVEEGMGEGLMQYVILGAGLDTFAQRRADVLDRLHVFEIDQPDTQAWKQRRLAELGLAVPASLHFVPVDFEAGDDWWTRVQAAGFDRSRPALVASTGVSMYLTKAATASTMRELARMAPGSIYAMTFLLPMDLVDEPDRAGLEMSSRGAAASGTPFVSFYTPDEIVTMARDAGFREATHVSSPDLAERYFSGRADGLRPSTGEDVLVART